MLGIDSGVVSDSLDMLMKTANELEGYTTILHQQVRHLDTMKNGPSIQDARQRILRLIGMIRQLFEEMLSLHGGAAMAAGILLDCERDLVKLAGDLQTGGDLKDDFDAPLIISRSNPVRAAHTISDQAVRNPGYVVPEWYRRIAHAYFSG